MNTKHPASVYLSQYGAIKKQIEALQNELEFIRAASSRAATSWDTVRTSNKGAGDFVATLAVRAVDVEQRLSNTIEGLKECLDMRLWLLEQMDNPTEKLILTYRYINGLDWRQIFHKLNYGESNTFKIHGNALQHFWAIYQKGGFADDASH